MALTEKDVFAVSILGAPANMFDANSLADDPAGMAGSVLDFGSKPSASPAPHGHAAPPGEPGHEKTPQKHEDKKPDGEKSGENSGTDPHAGEAKEEEKPEKTGEGGKPAEGGKTGEYAELALTILNWISSQSKDVTLKAPHAMAMPKGKDVEDFKWTGPMTTVVEYPLEKTIPLRGHMAYAKVEIRFWFSGKYINDFGAVLVGAELESLDTSLDAELLIDHFDVNPAGGIAYIDWVLTFRRSHWTVKKVLTFSGRAHGDGTMATPIQSD